MNIGGSKRAGLEEPMHAEELVILKGVRAIPKPVTASGFRLPNMRTKSPLTSAA